MKPLLRLLQVAFAIGLPGSFELKAGQIPATIHSVNEGVELCFNTVSNSHYEIHHSANLSGWTLLESAIPGTAVELIRDYPTAGVPKRFFQVFAVTVPAGLAPVPAGNFIMGNSIAGDGILDAPQHQVTLSGFYMGRNLVTKAEWDAVQSWDISNDYSDLATGSGKAGNHPVQMVSWWDCIKYCNARSEMEGLTPVYTVGGAVMKTGTTVPSVNWNANGYRLPTEAEWEKAARGGLSEKRFPWGDTISHSQANYFALSVYSYDLSGAVNDYHPDYDVGGFPYTSPVGSFVANGYGLRDMVGNVWQWCWDCYGTYATGSPTDPRGAPTGLFRVIRGGSWDDPAYNCRVAVRNSLTPDNAFDTFGFRVVRSSVR